MEKVNLKEKTVCVIDERLCVSLAQRLAKDFGKVLYFSDWTGPFPYSKDNLVGTGIDGVERIETFWDKIDDIDCFVFPFIYKSDWQQHLKELGKRVWGSGYAEQVELDREDTNKDLKKFKLPQPEITIIKGIDNLREHLRHNKDVYIKVSKYRGDGETWKSEDIKTSTSKLDELAVELGPQRDDYPFIVENKIEGEEWGYDGFFAGESFPKKTIFGLEIKNLGYCCHVKNHKNISPLITDYLDAIAPTLALNGYTNFFHTENRITDKKESYPIDITCRMGLPPGELYMEMCSNISEVIYHGSGGEMCEPEFAAEFGLQCNIFSSRQDDKWNELRYPAEIERWVKLRSCMKKNGTWYIIPGIDEFFEIGALVTMGKSMDECISKMKELAKQIKGHLLEIKVGSIDAMEECIEKGKKLGIDF